jgi:2'-phosphotransferase
VNVDRHPCLPNPSITRSDADEPNQQQSNHPSKQNTFSKAATPSPNNIFFMPKMEQQRNNGAKHHGKGKNKNHHHAARPAGHTNSDTNASSKSKTSISNEKLSHSLTWALRHQAMNLGLTIQPDGYVPVQEILDLPHPKFKGATLEQIQQVVETSDKQRFRLEERPRNLFYPDTDRSNNKDETSTILCIRANQGHSMDCIDPNLLLTKLFPQELCQIPCIVHGTYPQAWQSIQQQGLCRMTRQHIHCASGLPKDRGVISGMRKSASVHVYIDAAKCAKDGVPFFQSDNGVLLTDGVEGSGILPPEYFSHVTDSSGNVLLDNRKEI